MGSDLSNIVWVVYGYSDFQKEKFKLRDRNENWELMHNKPSTGLWASPVDSKSGWSDFLKRDNWRTETLSKHYLFHLSPDANIYVIDDLFKLSRICDKELRNGALRYMGMKPSMNVDRLMEQYDGVFVTAEMAMNYHLAMDIPVSDLNSWDCESICIWNKDVIEVIPEEEIEQIMFNLQHENYYTPDTTSDWGDGIPDTKREFEERFYNRNIEDKQPFSQHPAILAQGNDDDRITQLARKYRGTVDSVMESMVRRLVRESLIKERLL